MHFCSLGGLTLLACFLLLGFATCVVEFLLKDVFALSTLCLQFKDGHLVVVVFLVIGTGVAEATGHVRLASVVVLAALVGHAADGAHADVLVNEVLGREIVEHFAVFDALVVFALGAPLDDFLKLLGDNGLHGTEHLDEVLGLLLEDGVVGQETELLVDALGPG